jgi:VWFA-related protein
LLVLSGLLCATVFAQQPQNPQNPQQPQQPRTFRSGTQVVEVDVRVFDKSGHFVTDLTPEDFEVKEDGAPQPINTLTLVTAAPSSTQHQEASTQHPAPSTAPSTEHPAPSTSPSTWVFVFDTLHLSPGGLDRARRAIETFLPEKFPQGAIGGVIVNGKMANNRLTSDHQELLKAVHDIKAPETVFSYQMEMTRQWPRFRDEFEAWMIAAHNDNDTLQRVVIRACSDDPDACKRGAPDMEVRDKARRIEQAAKTGTKLTLDIVRGLSNGLASMAGPKTVVFISEGFVLQEMESELRDVTGLANRGGAHFYTIDARGLNKGASSASIIDEPQSFDSAGPTNRFDMQEDGTNALAVDTGGMAIRNENNFGRALDEIQQDAGTYYVLGYTPANQTFDGKYRAIAVSVKRPGMKVRARRGYLALEPAKLLKPVPIIAAAPARPAASVASGPVGSLPGETTSISSLPTPPPAATALRSTIESRGFVEELQKSAERLSPTKADDLAGKGWVAYQKGDVEHAATYLAQAATSPDAHPWVRYALGLAHLALDQYPDAVRAWEQVRRDVPEFEPVYFNLADGYLLQKQDGSALNVLREAEKRWPEDPEVADAIGVLQVRRGALDAAVDSFTRATTVAPTDSLGFFNLARAYQMRAAKSQRYDGTLQKWVGGEGDLKNARENYEKYIRMGGPFVQQAKEALASLAWQGR